MADEDYEETSEVEWTFEQKADCFRKEIHARFEEENSAHRKEDAIQMEVVLKKDPGFYERPGHEHFKEITDSFFWSIYQESVIEVTLEHGVRIVLPTRFAIFTDLVEMFDNTEVCWSTTGMQPEIVDGEARIVLSIMLIDYWDDGRSRKWHEERRIKEARLLRKLRTI